MPTRTPDADTGGSQQITNLAEQRYHRLVDHSPDAICVHEGGRLVFVNQAGIRWMAAESADQLVGHPITEFVHPDSIGPMLARIATLRNLGDASHPSEAILRRFDGTTLDVEAVSVLTEWEGRPAYQVVFRDLTAQKAAQATLRYQAALVTHVSDAIIATTATGIVTSWNPAAETIYRRPATQALARTISETVGAPLDPAALVADGGITQTTHYAMDGAALDVRISAAAMDHGYVLVCTDHTALRRAEQHFETVVSALEEGVVVLRKDRHVESVNRAALRILGLQPDEFADAVRRADHLQLYGADGNPIPADQRFRIQTLSTGPVTGYILGIDRPYGHDRVWLAMNGRLLTPTDPDSAVLFSFTDITAQHTARERLTHQATHDALTGLPNRAQVEARAADALNRPDEKALTAVLFIDLDKLKVINDSHGHDAGDEILKIAAERLRRAVRTYDIVGRLGGDEFVALLFGPIDRGALDLLTKRLHTTLAEPVAVAGTTVRIRASIGIVDVQPGDPRDPAALLRDADLAMYSAKTTRRGTAWHLTNQSPDQPSTVGSPHRAMTSPSSRDQHATVSSPNRHPKHALPASTDANALE